MKLRSKDINVLQNSRKIKIVLIIAFLLVLLSLFVPSTLAAENGYNQQDADQIAQGFISQIPEEAVDGLDKIGVNTLAPEKIAGVSPDGLFSLFLNAAASSFSAPLRCLLITSAVSLLYAVINGFDASEGVKKTASAATVMAVAVSAYAPVISQISKASNLISECSNFMTAFVPAYSSVIAASGKPSTALVYGGLLIGAIQLISQLTVMVFVPLLSVILAVSLAGAVNSSLHIDSIINTVKSFVGWGLGLIMTVFVGLLGVQGVVTSAADTLGVKTAKFALGSFVPVVGGALSEAYGSVLGGLGLIKSTIGAFGILVIAVIFIIAMTPTLLMLVSVRLSAGVARILGCDPLYNALSAAGWVAGLMLAIVLCFGATFIISTSIVGSMVT